MQKDITKYYIDFREISISPNITINTFPDNKIGLFSLNVFSKAERIIRNWIPKAKKVVVSED